MSKKRLTPLQELAEWVSEYPTEVPTIHKAAVQSKIKQLLPRERVEVEMAYVYGKQDPCRFNAGAEEYYDETFKTEE